MGSKRGRGSRLSVDRGVVHQDEWVWDNSKSVKWNQDMLRSHGMREGGREGEGKE